MKGVFIITLVICALTASCEKNGIADSGKKPVEISLTASETKVAESGNNNSMRIFSSILENDSKSGNPENIIISPLSLNIALAMAWNGAEGVTKNEIQNTLGFDGYSEADVNNYFKKMLETLPKTDPTVKLAIANSIWHDKALPVLKGFLEKNSNYFYATIESLDFASPLSPGIINKWCSDKTEGVIKEVIEKIEPETVMFLINALYFKAPWSIKFDKKDTRQSPFYLSDGKITDVPTMSLINKSFNYYESSQLKAISLKYGNGAFNMTIILPGSGQSVNEIGKLLKSDGFWNTIINGMKETKIDIYLPKFKFDYKTEFNSSLKEMGMVVPFDPYLADFSKIANVKPQNLYISKVFQKAAIEVDEEGSEAAAVTVVGFGVTSVPIKKEFRADKPFIFAITESTTGTILFMGKVSKP
ncbi:MAG: serpin family protein [Bacteroidales bacterium]|nr:serpin family protein [Bacteroidales bacterium]